MASVHLANVLFLGLLVVLDGLLSLVEFVSTERKDQKDEECLEQHEDIGDCNGLDYIVSLSFPNKIVYLFESARELQVPEYLEVEVNDILLASN